MLILTRRVQEAIMIGDDVTITVLSVKGNQVRLGIDAPKNVEVHREEIFHRVKAGLGQGAVADEHVADVESPSETRGNR